MDETALDSLNMYRIRSMSQEALRRRIWKIRKVEKMASFIKVPRGLWTVLTRMYVGSGLGMSPGVQLRFFSHPNQGLLHSRVQVLKECGETELAEEAAEALAELGGG